MMKNQKCRRVMIACAAFFLFSANLSAQTTLSIISGNDHAALPYATVTNLTGRKTYSADSEGSLKVNATLRDTLLISYTGYKPAEYIYKGDGREVITLFEDPSVMEPVTVTDCKKKETLQITNFKKKGLSNGDTLFYWGFSDDKGKYAVRINSTEKRSVLSSLSFWVEKLFGASRISAQAPFMITFFEADDSTGLPGRPLSAKPVIYAPSATGRQSLKLDSLHIVIPENGMYVSFQYILDEKYFWSYTPKNSCPTCPKVINGYGGNLKFAKDSAYHSAEYAIYGNYWSFMRGNMAVQFEATVRYCKEGVE